jgi:hypothetical protein
MPFLNELYAFTFIMLLLTIYPGTATGFFHRPYRKGVKKISGAGVKK